MDKILVKFPLTIKAKLTEKLKNSMLEEMQNGIKQAELEISQINIQEERAVQQESGSGEENLAMIHRHFGMERQKREEYVAQTQARLEELEKLAFGAEIVQGQSERFAELKVGDNIRDQFNVEVVVEDDKIIAIRS